MKFRMDRWVRVALISAFGVVAFGFLGCTAPTQKVAVAAEQVADRQDNTIVTDLVNLAKQAAVDAAAGKVAAAATKGDSDSAAAAAIDGMNAFDKIGWLQVEYAKSRAARQIVKQFLWSQQGILDLMLDKAYAEKALQDATESTATTQPAG